MRSKKFLALTLAFCMACSGTVPVGAASAGAAAPKQQEETAEDVNGQALEEELSDPVILEEGNASADYGQSGQSVSEGSESKDNGLSGNEGQQQPDSGEPTQSDNQTGDQDAVSANWVRDVIDPDLFRLEKIPGSKEFFLDVDGIVKVQTEQAPGFAYYTFDKNGVMQTGICEISGNNAGTYYFRTKEDCVQEGDTNQSLSPLTSRIGQLVTEEGWRKCQSGDGERWLWLNAQGAWDTSKVGRQTLPDNQVYHLSLEGKIEKGVWDSSDGIHTYYFDKDSGVMLASQVASIDGSTYYFGEDGAMVVNAFQRIGNKQYYFDEQGKRFEKTGWQRLDGSWYYFAKDYSREIKTKWQKITENGTAEYYYFDSEGKMARNEFVNIDGYRYRVDNTGRRLTGLQKIDGQYYYFRPKKEGNAPIGSAYKGWLKISGRWYRFKSNYQAQTSSLVSIGGKYYSFTSTGKMYKGGLKQINGKYYYFEKQTAKARKGYAVTKKWVKKSGKWYYATAKAVMKANGWLKNKGNYYYFGSDSVMVKNKWMQRDGKWGYLGTNGVFSQNWVKVSGKWKYAKKNGTFAKGWTTLKQNGAKYRFFFNKKGFLIEDVRNRVSGPYMLKVDRKRNQITVYAKGPNGAYNTPVVAFPCSVGLPATPTPVGTFTGTRAGRWQELMGPSYGQYATLVEASSGIFIHSVAGSAPNVYSLPYGEWNKLGRSAASHGCIRVAVADAKWIYENCNNPTVEVRDYANAGPFSQKTYRKINSSYNWDPTDPAGKGYL